MLYGVLVKIEPAGVDAKRCAMSAAEIVKPEKSTEAVGPNVSERRVSAPTIEMLVVTAPLIVQVIV